MLSKKKLAEIRIQVRLAAQEQALRLMVRVLAGDEALRPALELCIQSIREIGKDQAIPGTTPEYSMLFAAEVQDVYDHIADMLQKELDAS